MIVALSYIIATILSVILAVLLYPIAGIFWILGLFGHIADGIFFFTKKAISALWRDLRNMNTTSNAINNSNIRSWTCSCGCINTGKFCSECGSPEKIYIIEPKSTNSWTCSCGSENTGNFCKKCGNKR